MGRALAADLIGARPEVVRPAMRVWDRVTSDSRLWPRPSRRQVGAVLVALAGVEHAEVMLSAPVRDLGADEHLSGEWVHLAGLTRYLRLVADGFTGVGGGHLPIRVLARRRAV